MESLRTLHVAYTTPSSRASSTEATRRPISPISFGSHDRASREELMAQPHLCARLGPAPGEVFARARQVDVAGCWEAVWGHHRGFLVTHLVHFSAFCAFPHADWATWMPQAGLARLNPTRWSQALCIATASGCERDDLYFSAFLRMIPLPTLANIWKVHIATGQ